MMKEMTSGISTNPARLTSQISKLKGKQDEATARMGSDTVAVMGTPDPDFYGFLTEPFQEMKPVTVGSGAGLFGTIAILPKSQQATIEDRYYHPATPFVMDRAGTANTGVNILRSGKPPAGYYGGQKTMVQKRVKKFFRGDHFMYAVELRAEAKDYVLQPDERFDGGFYPGSTQMGVERPYGWTFPVAANGQRAYTGDPYSDTGWNGAVYSVPDNPATKPVIDSISPTSFTLGDDPTFLTITGSNFNGGFPLDNSVGFTNADFKGVGFVLIGPFKPVQSVFGPRLYLDDPGSTVFDSLIHWQQPDGAYYYRDLIDDTTITLRIPGPDWVAGTYDVMVIGHDGQVSILPQSFTINEEAE